MLQKHLIGIPKLLPKATIFEQVFSEGFKVHQGEISSLHAKQKVTFRIMIVLLL